MSFGSNLVGAYLAGSLIGFSAGAAISILLLVLTVRAAKLPGGGVTNILFSLCSLTWNLGGLAHAIAITAGVDEAGRAALIVLAIQFSAAAAWPISVFALWSPLATQPWQRVWFRVLETLSVLSCGAIVVPLWYGALAGVEYKTLLVLKESTAYNGAILLTLGIALFRERLVSRTMRLPSLAMLIGVFGATLACVIQQLFPYERALCCALDVLGEQLTLFIVLGAFFLFARFRFSDLFIRYSLRVVLAALTAAAFMLLDNAISSLRFENHAAFPQTARIFAETLAAIPLLFLFAFVDRHLGESVERWIFRAPDYRTFLSHLSATLTRLHDDLAIAKAVETAASQALEVARVSLIPREKFPESSWPDLISNGESVELDCRNVLFSHPELAEVELLVPVRVEGRISHIVAVAPGYARRGLVTHEVNFLQNVAARLGHRLDALRMEERAITAQSRESVLQQQITEAELRALRAQINPHFLFNSLNSIANLVMTNPEKAETMTLRLARVFRHVLANSVRPLISLQEEIEFLRTYLQIEEARFGDRLRVEIVMDPAVTMEPIPSLILQPIVENALKHGLAPKPGPGHLWITADRKGDHLRLRVEDDGVGPGNDRTPSARHSSGVGLENVAQRLNALYQDQSRITLEMRKAGGTCVTILLPRGNGVAA